MTYTQIGIAVVIAAIVTDVLILRTHLVTRRGFWVAYAIVLFFQLLTNGVLTRLQVFRYSDSMIVGYQPDAGPPPFIGSGRIAYQPFEDLLMGFALCLLAMALWIYWGRRGVQREPMSGPPIWRTWAARRRSGSSGSTASTSGTASTSAAGADPGGPGDREPTA
ncbi:MAG: lycopene cyclase domain-containing protein [Candidatus Nanopelagicales bacterium]